MKLVIVAGPASVGKTAVVRQIIREFRDQRDPAYVKIDVVRAFEDEELKEEFGIPTRKVYSGDLCPDHTGIMVLQTPSRGHRTLDRASSSSKVQDSVSGVRPTPRNLLGLPFSQPPLGATHPSKWHH